MMIRKSLFVTDFEELWFDALQSLMDLRGAPEGSSKTKWR